MVLVLCRNDPGIKGLWKQWTAAGNTKPFDYVAQPLLRYDELLYCTESSIRPFTTDEEELRDFFPTYNDELQSELPQLSYQLYSTTVLNHNNVFPPQATTYLRSL